MYTKTGLSRTVLSQAGLIACLLITLTACFPTGDAAPTPTPLPLPVSYEKAIFTVERGPIVSEASLSGRVWPSKHDELHFLADGYVARVTVSEGDEVKAGDLLAELQVEDLMSQLDQAQINLDAAKTKLVQEMRAQQYAIDRAQRQVNIEQIRVEMARLAVEQSTENGEDLRALELQLALAEENLALARIALAEASDDADQNQRQAIERMDLEVDRLEAQLAERRIVAPYDGIVLERRIAPGDQAYAFGTGLVIGDPTEPVVRVRQDLSLVGKLDEDSEILMHFAHDKTRSYAAEFLPGFLPLSNEPTESRGTNQDWIYFSAPPEVGGEHLTTGQPVQLTVVLGRADDALLVPPEAVHEFRGRRYLIVRDGERQRRVDVRVGLETNDHWQVIGDVHEGDQVVGP
jgi:multidrug efflux pump subunit AcrA (membrane-fusion protein)